MTWRDWTARLHVPTLAVAALIIAGWWLLSLRYGAYVLPSPASVVVGLREVVSTGDIAKYMNVAPASVTRR